MERNNIIGKHLDKKKPEKEKKGEEKRREDWKRREGRESDPGEGRGGKGEDRGWRVEWGRDRKGEVKIKGEQKAENHQYLHSWQKKRANEEN